MLTFNFHSTPCVGYAATVLLAIVPRNLLYPVGTLTTVGKRKSTLVLAKVTLTLTSVSPNQAMTTAAC